MFSAAFASEEARLQPMLLGIPIGWQEQLSKLIEHDNGLNKLNSLRADQKDFQFTAVRFEIEKSQKIEGLYHFADQFYRRLNSPKMSFVTLLMSSHNMPHSGCNAWEKRSNSSIHYALFFTAISKSWTTCLSQFYLFEGMGKNSQSIAK